MTKFIFGMRINIEVFYKLILSFCVCVTRHAQSTQSKKFVYLCNFSRKIWGMNLIFWLQINTTVIYKLIVSQWVCIAKHAQNIQNKQFAMSLEYLKENGKNGVGFWSAGKCQRFLQIDAISLAACDQPCPN